MNERIIRERDHLNVELAELKETCRGISPKVSLYAKCQARIQEISVRLNEIATTLRGELAAV